MKHWTLLAGLSLCAAPAVAESMLYDPVKRADTMLSDMDRNHDGSISRVEYLRPATFRFNRFDVDKSGKLSRDELFDYWKKKRKVTTDNVNAWRGPTNAHFKRHDANGDDIITKNEYLSASKLKFKALDLDSDDMITQQELVDHWVERQQAADRHDFSEDDDD